MTGEPTALSCGMEFSGPWGSINLEDIQFHVLSPLMDIQVTSPPATDPWGGIDLKDI